MIRNKIILIITIITMVVTNEAKSQSLDSLFEIALCPIKSEEVLKTHYYSYFNHKVDASWMFEFQFDTGDRYVVCVDKEKGICSIWSGTEYGMFLGDPNKALLLTPRRLKDGRIIFCLEDWEDKEINYIIISKEDASNLNMNR